MDEFVRTRALAGSWWSIALRGVIAIAAAIVAFVVPGATIAALVILLGAYFLVDGVLALVNGERHRSGWTLVRGALGVVAGIAMFAWPAASAFTVIILLAAWAIAAGVLDVVGGIEFRRELHSPWLVVLGGVLTIILGCVAIASPAVGAVALSYIFGWYALVFGCLMIALAFQVRSLRSKVGERPLVSASPRPERRPPPPPERPSVH